MFCARRRFATPSTEIPLPLSRAGSTQSVFRERRPHTQAPGCDSRRAAGCAAGHCLEEFFELIGVIDTADPGEHDRESGRY